LMLADLQFLDLYPDPYKNYVELSRFAAVFY
jgi:hypothetical protein